MRCDLWIMKLIASKAKTIIVSWSRTIHHQSTPITLDGTVQKESVDLVILGVTFDSKMTFEKHLWSVSMQSCNSEDWYHEKVSASILLRSFCSIVLPVLEYSSTMWCSTVNSHLKLLDRFVRNTSFLAGGVLECNLAHRRYVAVVCMPFKNKNNPNASSERCIIFTVCASVCYSAFVLASFL